MSRGTTKVGLCIPGGFQIIVQNGVHMGRTKRIKVEYCLFVPPHAGMLVGGHSHGSHEKNRLERTAVFAMYFLCAVVFVTTELVSLC